MHLEEELKHSINNIMRALETKDRDVELISYFYGFGDNPWPTLEETANKFKIGTRECVRQIIETKFKKKSSELKIHSTYKITEILNSYDYVTSSDLCDILRDEKIIDEEINIKGVLNLLNDFNLCKNYDIYTPYLERASRNDLKQYENLLIVKKDYAQLLKREIKTIATLPGQHGLCNLSEITKSRSSSLSPDKYFEFFKSVITAAPDSWSTEDKNGAYWYLFENRDNTIVNGLEKIFSISESVNVKILSETLRNALYRRSQKYSFPTAELIEKYLYDSSLINIKNGYVYFLGKDAKFNDIEKDVIEYFEKQSSSSYPDLLKHLIKKGYGKPHADKSIFHSPLVYIDKSKGRLNYRYFLINRFSEKQNLYSFGENKNRYFIYKMRLGKIAAEGTDKSIESKRRREQNILQDWIFEGKDTLKCAICGENYDKSALVAAHKKKRSICTENERLDPHIVMPLCLFGCDYLYENGYIYVLNGKVQSNSFKTLNGYAVNHVRRLIGRDIDKIWLEGESSYFFRP